MNLSPRQRQVLALRCDECLGNAEIADRLFLSVWTVRGYLTEIFYRLGIEGGRESGNGLKSLRLCRRYWTGGTS